MIDRLINQARQELRKYIDEKYQKGEKRFFKEKIKNIGVRVPNRRLVARQLWSEVRQLPKEKLLQIIEKMLAGYVEETTIALDWLYRNKANFMKKDFVVFERWLEKYIDNWSKCDDFCTHSIGFMVNLYPELLPKVFKWTRSKNRWVKRASAVTLIYPFGKKKRFLEQIFKTAEALLTDPDDMVQKGYGWMLKEASKYNQKQVFEFVMRNKIKMPRTALRYAIEKMPESLRKRAMKP